MSSFYVSLWREKISRRGFNWSLFVILSAILIISGFFVYNALALAGITVTAPNGGEYWSGTRDIEWAADCEGEDYINIQYSTGGVFQTIDTVSCDPKIYRWNTESYSDGSNYQIRIYLEGDFGTIDISDNAFTIDKS